ncbi:hypothetical protein K6V96_00390 [Streptococcus suis]|nr:hypothetical protein [Streptococcus suis]HEM3163672.1 hypothetical protein [Streptococcus suis 92-1191]MBY5026297.1 hypothetical protein [Streptococcus suis]MBY5029007.1 hypothetical protein [Streptococcus suis]MCK3942629.1 hypothetical protein [Streptococcus suis]
MLSDPFDVVHIDSHADLVLGGASWSFCKVSFLHIRLIQEEKLASMSFAIK